MLKREDLTDQEFAFLVSQKILLSHLYDARGLKATGWDEAAKAEDKLFGLSDACPKGHRLKTRKGHCIECDTSRIAYIRRYSDSGYIYIAATKGGQLLKVGSCSDTESRAKNLRVQSYGGFSDWEIIASCKVSKMGLVEFGIHKALEGKEASGSYEKNGRKQEARELFDGDLVAVWRAFNIATKAEDASKKWRHPNFSAFNFKAK